VSIILSYAKLQVSVWHVLAALCMAYINYHYDFSVNFTSLRHICLQSTISWQVDLVYRLLQHQGCVEIHCVQNMRQLWQAVALTSMDQF